MTKIVDWQRKRIFKLAGQMGLDNDMLHSHLLVIADKDSIKKLTYKEANSFINSLQGVEEQSTKMSAKQFNYIKALAKELGWVDENKKLDNKRLQGFIEVRFKISRYEWIPKNTAAMIIEALKAMKGRVDSENE